MRTTFVLDDDVVPSVRKYAKTRQISMGKAVSELVRRGLKAPLRTRLVNGFHVVELPENSPRVTSEQVRELEPELR